MKERNETKVLSQREKELTNARVKQHRKKKRLSMITDEASNDIKIIRSQWAKKSSELQVS